MKEADILVVVSECVDRLITESTGGAAMFEL